MNEDVHGPYAVVTQCNKKSRRERKTVEIEEEVWTEEGENNAARRKKTKVQGEKYPNRLSTHERSQEDPPRIR